MTSIRIPAELEMHNQMLKKKECKSHFIFVRVEKEHVTFSIENAQDDFKFFREGNIEDLHLKIPSEAIKAIHSEILDKEKHESYTLPQKEMGVPRGS